LKTPVCLICRLKYKNAQTRDQHGKRAHGEPNAKWQGLAEDYPSVKFQHAMPGRHVRPGDNSALPDLILAKTRTIPPKEDRGQADLLEALPWVRVPRNPQACDNVAAACGAMARSFDNVSETFTALMSLRDYYLACGARLRKQKAAA